MSDPLVRVLPALAVSLALSVCACGGGSASTTGKRVTLKTRAEVESALHAPFTTSFGWTISLESAKVALGALYYFDGEPAFVRNETPRGVRRAWDFGLSLVEGVAHAHPGHYQAGNALGEMLEEAPVDLFAPGALGQGDGVTGPYRSARFVFAKERTPAVTKALGNFVAIVTGTAQKAGDAGTAPVTHFRITATFADVAAKAAEGRVEGCAFKEADVEGDGSVTVTFKPTVWFDLVDFKDVAPGTADTPTDVPSGDVAQIGFALGLVQLTAYDFSFSG